MNSPFVFVAIFACVTFCHGNDEAVPVTEAPEEEASKAQPTGEEFLYSEEDFETNVKHAAHFVMFFAPWCGHCQNLKPIWAKLAEDVNTGSGIDITIAKVDCTKETKLCSDEGVNGYPTLKLYQPHRNALRHTGERDLDSLKSFVKAALKPRVDAVAHPNEGLYDLTEDTFDEHVAHGFHLIKFYAPWCGHCRRLEPTWQDLARAHIPSDDNADDVKIGRVDCTKHRSVCQQHEVRGYPTLLWFADGEMVKKYQGSRDLKSFQAFIKSSIGASSDDEEEPEEQNDAKPLIEDSHVHEQVKKTPPPVFDEKKEEKDGSKVVILTEENFEYHTAVDAVFVKFYAPWCGYCKQLAPVWDDLAEEDFSAVNLPVKIAKVDCTKHNQVCKKYEVRGYPTLILFVDGENSPQYSGSRAKKELKNYVIQGVQQYDGAVEPSRPAPPPPDKDEL